MTTRKIAVVGVIAGLYASLTYLLAGISFLPQQVRFAEALTVLPYLTPLAIPGLTLGVFLANLASPLGWIDWVFGTLATLLAAVLTGRARHPALAPLPPVVVNAVGVGYYLSYVLGLPYLLTAGQVALGQLIACYLLGYPMLLALRARPALLALLRGEA